MAKQKVGLQKQVTDIFNGVSVPKGKNPYEQIKTPPSKRLFFLRPKSSKLGQRIRWIPKPPPPAWLPVRAGQSKQTKTGIIRSLVRRILRLAKI